VKNEIYIPANDSLDFTAVIAKDRRKKTTKNKENNCGNGIRIRSETRRDPASKVAH